MDRQKCSVLLSGNSAKTLDLEEQRTMLKKVMSDLSYMAPMSINRTKNNLNKPLFSFGPAFFGPTKS